MSRVELNITPVKGFAYPIESALSAGNAGTRCIACNQDTLGFVGIGPISREELCLCRKCHGIAVGRDDSKPDEPAEGVTLVPVDAYDNEVHGHDN